MIYIAIAGIMIVTAVVGILLLCCHWAGREEQAERRSCFVDRLTSPLK